LSMLARLSQVIFLTAVTSLSFFIFFSKLPHSPKILVKESVLNISAPRVETRTILYYTPWWPDHASPGSWDLGEGSSPFAHCPEKNCVITSNRSLLPSVAQFDALLFHSWNLFHRPGMTIPKLRSLHQRYILFSLEPASHCAYLTPWEEKVLANFFNDTFTFRTDSSISCPYGRVIRLPSKTTGSQNIKELAQAAFLERKDRTRSVLWIASHCWTDSKREVFVKQLNNFIPVTVVGKCAKLLGQTSSNEDDLGKFYFYLAFENSICKDYVTEKFFRGLQAPVVPVVLGGANYSAIAPNHSFIHVDDFASPEQLAIYLNQLISEPEEYLKYFWWKPHFQVLADVDPVTSHLLPSTFPCNLCSHLHQAASSPPSMVSSLEKDWRKAAACQETFSYHCNRDREAWFPGRNQTASRLKERGKELVVELQEIAS